MLVQVIIFELLTEILVRQSIVKCKCLLFNNFCQNFTLN